MAQVGGIHFGGTGTLLSNSSNCSGGRVAHRMKLSCALTVSGGTFLGVVIFACISYSKGERVAARSPC